MQSVIGLHLRDGCRSVIMTADINGHGQERDLARFKRHQRVAARIVGLGLGAMNDGGHQEQEQKCHQGAPSLHPDAPSAILMGLPFMIEGMIAHDVEDKIDTHLEHPPGSRTGIFDVC